MVTERSRSVVTERSRSVALLSGNEDFYLYCPGDPLEASPTLPTLSFNRTFFIHYFDSPLDNQSSIKYRQEYNEDLIYQ